MHMKGENDKALNIVTGFCMFTMIIHKLVFHCQLLDSLIVPYGSLMVVYRDHLTLLKIIL
jgi:hypothetical protein